MNITGIDERCIEQLITFNQGIIQFWNKDRTVVDSIAFTDATAEEILAYAVDTADGNPFEMYVETTGNPLGHPDCEYLFMPFNKSIFTLKNIIPTHEPSRTDDKKN